MDRLASSLPEEIATQLEKEAGEKGMTLHHSFRIELVNYSRHVDVEDLPPEKLKLVLTEIGKVAIRRAHEQSRVGTREVPGEDVRMAITMLCDPFSYCYSAAEKILEDLEAVKV